MSAQLGEGPLASAGPVEIVIAPDSLESVYAVAYDDAPPGDPSADGDDEAPPPPTGESSPEQ
jgi:hypothetical protein